MEVCILAAKLNLSSIIAYPNPSSGNWNVQFANLSNRQLFLYDYMGRLVWHSTVTDLNTIIPGQQLTTGVYLLKILSKSEENTIKLIKQ
ncbi:MAG TPA: T9SS type A sorting domain-containing protein [Chitinophagaceae bacterium]|nr:T9SS type A sorting domain-containing protein [Chitinophagaceae bacterium]